MTFDRSLQRLGRLLAAAALTASTASVADTADSAAAALAIDNATGSTLVKAPGEESLFLVLPPSAGAVSAGETQFHANTAFCDDMQLIQKASREASQKLFEVGLELEPFFEKRDALRQELRPMERTLATLNDARLRASATAALEGDVARLEARLVEARGANDTANIEKLERALSKARAHQESERALLERARTEAPGLAERVRQLRGEIDAIETDLDARLEARRHVHRALLDLYARYAVLKGGTAGIDYRAPWTDNVHMLNRAQTGARYQKMEVEKPRLHATLAPMMGNDAYLASLPALLGYRVNGNVFDPKNPDDTLAEYPESVFLELELSLVGACPQKQAPGTYDLARTDAGAPTYAISSTYEYEVQSPVCARVRHNPWRVVEHFERDGRFLDVTPERVRSLPSDAFRIDWCGEQPPDAVKADLELEQGTELAEQALSEAGRFGYSFSARVFHPRIPRTMPPLVWPTLDAQRFDTPILIPPRRPQLPRPVMDIALDRAWSLDAFDAHQPLTLETVALRQSERWRTFDVTPIEAEVTRLTQESVFGLATVEASPFDAVHTDPASWSVPIDATEVLTDERSTRSWTEAIAASRTRAETFSMRASASPSAVLAAMRPVRQSEVAALLLAARANRDEDVIRERLRTTRVSDGRSIAEVITALRGRTHEEKLRMILEDEESRVRHLERVLSSTRLRELHDDVDCGPRALLCSAIQWEPSWVYEPPTRETLKARMDKNEVRVLERAQMRTRTGATFFVP